MKFLTVSVIASLILCVLFTITVLILNCMGIEVSDTLIQYFFTVFGIEFSATAAIKISKHIVDRQKVKDKIDLLKENNLEIEKSDLSTDENSYDDTVYYDTGDDTYYG